MRRLSSLSTPQSQQRTKKRPSGAMTILFVIATVFYLPVWIHVQMNMNRSDHTNDGMNFGIPSLEAFLAHSNMNKAIRPIQKTSMDDGRTIRELEDRVSYLETKLNAYLAFTSDPFLSTKSSATCSNQKEIKELACKADKSCALDNQMVCLDNFPNLGQRNTDVKPCVVYDFGIRESPEYGLAFAQAPFQCQVFGFDPSPISVEWWKNNDQKIRQDHPKYTFQPYGAGGHDGLLELREYDWGQVSILEYPSRVIDTNNCTIAGCRYKKYELQKSFNIPVKTLKTVMAELGHNRIDLLKLDVEGSEYTFLERMIDDRSCRQVDQLTLEWHHYDYDTRYGVTSNPQINVLVALLKDRCGLEQYWVHGSKGWPSNQKMYAEMGMTLYYTLSSFKRTKWD